MLFRCCPRTLRLLPLCPSNAGSAGARARICNPPTTACGATSVFETPSVLRESLPSYSAKPGAFYAPRALRWTTPPRGRTDPFQGPKIKPMFHRLSMLFQDDFGVENGSQIEVNIVPKSCLGALRSWSRVAVRCAFLKLWGDLWAHPEPRNSCSRHKAGPISA